MERVSSSSTTGLACYTGNCYLEVNSYDFETTNAVDLTWSDGLRDSLCCSRWGVSQGCFETGVGCAPMVSFGGYTTRYELSAVLTVPQITPDTPLILQEGALSSDAYLATPDGTRMSLVLREGTVTFGLQSIGTYRIAYLVSDLTLGFGSGDSVKIHSQHLAHGYVNSYCTGD